MVHLLDPQHAVALTTDAARVRLEIAPATIDRRGLELWIRLSRDPQPGAVRIDDLIAGAVLRLPIALASSADTSTSGGSLYFRSVRFSLCDRRLPIESIESKGEQPACVITAILDRAAAFEAARALAGRSASLDVQAVATTGGAALPITIVAPLADLARDADGGLERWGRLIAPDPTTGELRRIPVRARTVGSRAVAARVRDVARFGGAYASVSAVAALSPIHAAPASAIAVHPSVAVTAVDVHSHVIAEAGTIFPPANRRPHLPLVLDANEELWPGADRVIPYWYLPSFTIVQPDPSRPATDSPFTFRFKESGHDVDGRPGLDATITLTLRQVIGETVAARLAELGNPEARPVQLQNFAVSLSIPFRDGQGQLRREMFTAATTIDGDLITATIPLLDNWARLAYGALAVDGFQAEPARVQIAAYFNGVQPADPGPFPIAFEPKYHVLPAPFINSRDADGGVSLATPTGTVAFARPAARDTRAVRPLTAAQVVAVHGQLHGQAIVAAQDRVPIYVQETFARTREVPCLFPCDRLGAFYLQQTDDGDVPVGCRDALKLGETDYRLYASVDDARFPRSLRVLRSLLQPGRFVIVPASYQIARFGADAGERAYHPAIFLYSSLDAANPSNNRAALMATLGPAVTAHELEHVREILRELSPKPVLQFVTEIPSTVSYAWSLANGEIVKNQQALRRWDSFQVSMSVDLEQAPVLESMLQTNGMSVVATFALPDGTNQTSALDLDLNGIVGPIGATPAEVGRVGGGATLTNRIDVALDVDDLLVIDDAATPGQASIATVPVQKTLAPGESLTVAGDIAATARLVPAVTPKQSAATLEEIRSFVEDVLTQMAFINLVAFDNHSVSLIAIAARVKETEGLYSAVLRAADSVQVVEIVLPLTKYLAHPVVEFQASVTRGDGTVQTTAWMDWPLETKGNVVGVSWELLGLAN